MLRAGGAGDIGAILADRERGPAIAHQPPSAWSFHVEIRPFGENW